MDTTTTHPAHPSNPSNELSFAEQAARGAFGHNYVHPLDREFQDREPRWQKLGTVAGGVVNRLRRQRDHDDHHHDVDAAKVPA